MSEKIGSVMIVGGGIAGTQAALDLSESGYKVYIIESSGSIGGVMAQLDKTFPTNDCSMCILSPKLVQAGRHQNIEIITMAKITGLEGKAGNFKVDILKKSRFIDEEKCTGCGICAQECPIEAIDVFNEDLSISKAISVKFPQAVPLYYSINKEKCIGCGICQGVCKVKAINYTEEDHEINLNVGSILLAQGFDEFDPTVLKPYGYGKHPNVVTSIEFERILSASGPYSGMVLRPSDGTIPEKVAFLQCIGSRDCHHGKEYCSSVCCMYTAKEAVIAKEHQQQVNPTIFTMDIRAYGKDFDKYIERAQEEYGVRYIRSRIPSIEENPVDHDLILTYESEKGEIISETFNMVVLAVGINPPSTSKELSSNLGIELNEYGFCQTRPFSPTQTTKDGIFVCGAFSEPKDIPESVVQASAAASHVNALLSSVRNTEITKKEYPEEQDVSGEDPRVGVFICHCGINIGGVVNVPEVVEYTKTLPNVAYAESNLYTCSADTQISIKEKIIEHNLNRVVVASCTPRTHEPLFRETVKEAGLNQYLFQMTNIRDQCSWVHMHQPEEATEKAKDLVKMAIFRVQKNRPLQELDLEITPNVLVIGGGVSGLNAALNLAQQGHSIYLVEKDEKLGGFARNIHKTIEGYDVQNYLNKLIERVKKHNKITIFKNTNIKNLAGYLGNFKTTVINEANNETQELEHGVIIVATGAVENRKNEYNLEENSNIITQSELELMLQNKKDIKKKQRIVMIQCVGSRNEEHPYCSRICCSEAIKNALSIKALNSDCEVVVLYRDMRTYGFKESFYRKAREKGVIFLTYNKIDNVKVNDKNRNMIVTVKTRFGENFIIESDLVVLSTGLISPEGTERLSKMLKVPLNDDNFFLEAHVKLRPVDFATEGIFLCGTARAPATIEESISQGRAAAARAMTILAKDVIHSEGVTSSVDEELCTGCRICIRLCPYNAIERNELGVAVIREALCKGCGLCAASCPEKAIIVKHFEKDQILAELTAFGGEYIGV
ncbi:MAG: FAD-dependent oxidoreductase [Candidatus Lokiarchaeota archaeon]|nr:FAD-dependent oxidoreductase [Candidatus Lokiarchaeota archaeon]